MALSMLFSYIGNAIITKKVYDGHQYIFYNDIGAELVSLRSIMSFYLIYNLFLPLDLAVNVELTALVYIPFVSIDSAMAYENREFGRIDKAKANSVNLLENLGEVEFILSDKTGTLTKNQLSFKEIYYGQKE